jgi:hypothetical protein
MLHEAEPRQDFFEAAEYTAVGGPSRTRTLDPLIKSDDEQRTKATRDDLNPPEPE